MCCHLYLYLFSTMSTSNKSKQAGKWIASETPTIILYNKMTRLTQTNVHKGCLPVHWVFYSSSSDLT